VDGLNWDLMNDGMGNPKNTRSMLYSHETPPVMSLGVRAHAKVAVRAGFRYIQFTNVPENISEDVDIYLESLRPETGNISGNAELIEKGKTAFGRHNCVECHSGKYFTNLKSYALNAGSSQQWDTPTLCEIWRTAPYWHDGRYAALEEVFTIEKHGLTIDLDPNETESLVAYLNSL
jgi:CxxC motif-containing protein (DUF1111 family)